MRIAFPQNCHRGRTQFQAGKWSAALCGDPKQALVQDPATPFFTTDHFNGHPSVLLRLSRVGELSRLELAEVIEDAWLAQASDRRGRLYLEGTQRITA